MNTTVVRGASSGIGEAFARRLAASGRNVFLVARSEEKLATLCNELGRMNSIRAQYVALDLSRPEAPAQLFDECLSRGLVVDLLINNAGFGANGDFTLGDRDRALNMIDLNIKAVVDLTHRFLVPMRRRGAGTIINVASTAAFQPVPYMATYAATKAFVLSFTEALAEENRAFGITIMALCPGVTDTKFFEVAEIEKPPMRAIEAPEDVVETALRGLGRRDSRVVSGWTNFFVVEAQRFVPHSLVVRLVGKIMRDRYGPNE
jgi:uncharacterized protein